MQQQQGQQNPNKTNPTISIHTQQSSLISNPQGTISKQQQPQTQSVHQPLPSDEQLIRLIKSTYQQTTVQTEQINKVTEDLHLHIENQQFGGRLLAFLQNQVNQASTDRVKDSGEFSIQVSILLRKFSILYSKRQNTNKNHFIETVFQLLMSSLNPKAKQFLGIALEYILNSDYQNQYKGAVIQKLCQTMQSNPDENTIEGSALCCLACLNSLIEVEDQFDFLIKVIQPVNKNLMVILEFLQTRPQETLYTQDSYRLMKLARRLFDFIQLACSRISDEQDMLERDMNLLRQRPSLQMALYSYFNALGHFKSIISTIPAINAIKQILIEIVFHLYRDIPMPENIFNLLFITLMLQCGKAEFGQEDEHIISRIIELMEIYLDNKMYASTFYDHKMQLVLAMLCFIVTKPEELETIEDEPERFIELAEEFTEGFQASISIKVRAGAFLKVFATKFDQLIKNIVQIVVIIVSAAMESQNVNSQSPCVELYGTLKQQFPEFGFFQLDISLQLQCTFNVLSLLSKQISLREDLNRVVYALLVTHMANLQKISSPIVLLRLIRMVGYYPTAVYYPFIKVKMTESKVFVLEGLKSYERILKANKHPEIFALLSQVFEELLGMIAVNDSIFEIIVLNHYERMLRQNIGLFTGFITKIRDTFINLIESNQHLALLSLGYIYNILRKQPQASYRVKICQYFYAMYDHHKKTQDFYKQQKSTSNNDQEAKQKMLRVLSHYEEKITDVFLLIAKKQTEMDERVVRYAIEKISGLNKFNHKSEIFPFLNNVFLKIDGNFEDMEPFYKQLMNQIKTTFAKNDQISKHVDILPNVCFLVSQLLSCFHDLHLQKNDMFFLLKVIDFCPEQFRQHIILVLLTYIYVQPVRTRSLLIQQNCYEDVLKVLLTTKYEDPLVCKVFLLSMAKLLQIEENYFQDIIKQCLSYFKEQKEVHQTKTQKKKPFHDPKLRRMFQDNPLAQQEQMYEEEMVPISQHKKSPFDGLKHPLINLSEYDQFKVRVWQNMNVVSRLSEDYKAELREVLQMDWFGTGIRKIVAVKQNSL